MKQRKLAFKIFLLLGGFILLVLLITQTGFFKNVLRDMIVKQTNNILVDYELTIDKIEGTLFTSIKLKGLGLTSHSDTLITVKELSAKYSILPFLVHKIKIHELIITEIFLNLDQSEDGSWNISDIFPASEPGSGSSTQSKDNWRVELDDLRIENSSIRIDLFEENKYLPKRISEIDLQLRASYRDSLADFELKNFSLVTEEPEIVIRKLMIKGRSSQETLQIDAFNLATAMNQIGLIAIYALDSSKLESGSLIIENFNLAEFEYFLPELPVDEYPEISLKANLSKEHLESELNLVKQEQSIAFSTKIDSIYGEPEYFLEMNTAKVNINDWIKGVELPSILNLKLQLNGKGLDLKNLNGHALLQSYDSTILKKSIKTMLLEAEKEDGSGSFLLEFDGGYGSIDLSGKVVDLLHIPEFDLTGSLRNVDLAGFTGNSEMNSDLNCSFDLKGKGNNLDNLNSELNLNIIPSKIAGFDLDFLRSNILYDQGKYQINSFEAENTLIYLNISGSGNINADHDISFKIETRDLSYLSNYINIDKIKANANMTGSIRGTINELKLISKIDISDFTFNSISAETLNSNIVVNKLNDKIEADTEVHISDISSGTHTIDKLDIFSHGDMNRIENEITIHSDSLGIYNQNRIILDSLITVELPVIQLDYGDISFKTANESGKVVLNNNRILLENIKLDNKNGYISLEGYIDKEIDQDLSIEFSQIDLSQFNDLQILPYRFSGILDLKAELEGDSENPSFSADMDLSQPGINEINFKLFTGNLQLKDKILNSDFQIIRNENEKVKGNIMLPVTFDISTGTILIPKEEPVLAELKINDLELGFVEEFTKQIEDIKGNLNLDLKLENTLNDPKITGNISLREGELKYPPYGIEYYDLGINSTFDNDSLFINDITVKGGDGFLKISGKIDISQLQDNYIPNYQLMIKAEKFKAANRTDLNMMTNLDVNIQGDTTGSVFNGNIGITKSRIDLDKLQKNKSNTRDINEPLLIQALATKTVINLENDISKQKRELEILKNFTGKLRVIIPKNTWIKNKDMNLELSGDVEIIKTGNYFELFGSINTIRGNYKLYGRKFSFEEGMISFNGGNQMNPYLEIIIKYIFRDVNRNKREMKIALKGYSINPEINFLLDEETLSEADAVSYLIFGKSSDEISQSEKSQVSGYGQSDLARSLLTKEIGTRIADQLAKTLKINVIEFSGEENMKKGSILIGKYITNDLFVSYQKEFSIDQSKEIVPDKVYLEYEISKNFFLQATRGDEKSTGFDLYWKFNRK